MSSSGLVIPSWTPNCYVCAAGTLLSLDHDYSVHGMRLSPTSTLWFVGWAS